MKRLYFFIFFVVFFMGCLPKLGELSPWGEGGDTASYTDTDTDADTDIDSDTDTGTDADADTGTDSDVDTHADTDTDSGVDTATDTGVDTADTGAISPVVFFETDFGDGGTCSTSPFSRSDGGSMAYASNAEGEECGVYIFGAGTATAPAVSLNYSASGYVPGVEYTVEMPVEVVGDSSLTVFTDFGGGAVAAETLKVGEVSTLSVVWTADSSSATLRVWSDAASNYEVAVLDLTVSY